MEGLKFDIWTLLMLFSILLVVLGIVFLVFGHRYRASFSGIKTVGFSLIIAAIGTCLNALQNHIHTVWSLLTANMAILFGIYLLYLGAVRFIKSDNSPILNTVLLLIAVPCLVYFYIVNSVFARITIISAFAFFCFIGISYIFFIGSKPYNKKVYNTLALMFLFMALINIFRIVNAGINPTKYLLHAGFGQSLGIILLIVCMMIMSISFFNLVTNELNFIKNVFSSTLAHEMRTPFNSIIGFSQLLVEENLKKEDEIRYIKYINYSANRGMQSLDNLLEWSKSRIGNIKLNLEEINLDKLLDEVLLVNETLLEHKKINISKNLKIATLWADKQFMLLITSNLISNAIKFTPENGEIALQSELEAEYSCFSIENNGKALSKADIHMLEVNDLLNSKKGTNSEKGSGLGLYIVKSFVEIHKGKLLIESDGVLGSKFTVKIPQRK